MTSATFDAARPSRQPRMRFITARARQFASSGARTLLLTLLLTLAACNTSGQKSTARATPGAMTQTLFTGGGAVRTSDGSTLWSQNLGLAPALIAQGVVYSLTVSSPPPYPIVRAVRASDGSTLWTAQPAGCCGSIALAGGYVIVPVFQSGTTERGVGISGQLSLLALRTDTGKVAWQSDPVSAVIIPQLDTPAPFVSALAVSSSRIVAVASAAPDTGYVVAWNLADGKLAWRVPLGGHADYGAPALSITPSGAVVTVEYSVSQELATFDLATGKLIWHRQLGTDALDATTNGVDIFSDRATGIITGVRPWDGTTLWQTTLGPFGGERYWNYDVAADADTIYYRHFTTDCTLAEAQTACTPQISAINLSSGAVRWQRTLDPIDPDFAVHVLAHGDVLYYHYFITSVHAFILALDASDGHLLWRHMTDSYFVPPFIASDDALFAIGGDAKSACPARLESLSARDGSLRWTRPFPTCTEPSFRGGYWLLLG